MPLLLGCIAIALAGVAWKVQARRQRRYLESMRARAGHNLARARTGIWHDPDEGGAC